jgi:hypothetical protein
VLVEDSEALDQHGALAEWADRRVTTFDCRDQPINVRITSPTFLASCRAMSKLLVSGPGEGFLLLGRVWAPGSLGHIWGMSYEMTAVTNGQPQIAAIRGRPGQIAETRRSRYTDLAFTQQRQWFALGLGSPDCQRRSPAAQDP